MAELATVRVHTLSGQEISIATDQSSTVLELRSRVCEQLFLAGCQVHLTMGETTLKADRRLLHEVGIAQGTELGLFVTPLSENDLDALYRRVGARWFNKDSGKLELDRGRLAACPEAYRIEFLAGATADRRVSWLYLSDNGLGDADIGFIAEAIKRSTTLQTLVLRFNEIGDEGARLLADSLAHSSSLRDLRLNSNRIGDQGVSYLLVALKDSANMESIDLSCNRLTQAGKQAMADAQQKLADTHRRVVIRF
mmetsp:Transcript_703/g.1308  ORF Transcript_703/g.1308 Transcript_703/m.1308 type:complete len:252 (+) Transcript_703:95-850(+)